MNSSSPGLDTAAPVRPSDTPGHFIDSSAGPGGTDATVLRGRISGLCRTAHSWSKACFQVKKSELKLCAIVIDGMPLRGRQMIAAFGVAHNGEKTVLGLREGSVGGGEATYFASPGHLTSDHNGDR